MNKSTQVGWSRLITIKIYYWNRCCSITEAGVPLLSSQCCFVQNANQYKVLQKPIMQASQMLLNEHLFLRGWHKSNFNLLFPFSFALILFLWRFNFRLGERCFSKIPDGICNYLLSLAFTVSENKSFASLDKPFLLHSCLQFFSLMLIKNPSWADFCG